MRSGNRPSKSFTVFALAMIGFLVLGSIIVFGSTLFGGGSSNGAGSDQSASAASNAATAEVEQIAVLLTAVAEDPSDIGSTKVLANILANSGRANESLKYFDTAVIADPDDDALRLAYGIALYRTGNEFDAEVQLNKSLELNSERPDAAYYLGQLHENKEEPNLEKAREWYERAIEIEPESLVSEQAQQRLLELDDATPTP